MWGSRPLLTVSTANRLVLNTLQRLYIFTDKSRKKPEEFWTQPRDADQASYHTAEVWLHRDATRPLQRFPTVQQPTRFQDEAGHKAP
jgi:hypothetical protein